MGAEETQIEASFCEAIRIAKEQKSVSLEKRAEATYAEYRAKKRAGQEDVDSDYLFGNGANSRRVDAISATEFRSVHHRGSCSDSQTSTSEWRNTSGSMQCVKVIPFRRLMPPERYHGKIGHKVAPYMDCNVNFAKLG